MEGINRQGSFQPTEDKDYWIFSCLDFNNKQFTFVAFACMDVKRVINRPIISKYVFINFDGGNKAWD